MGTFQHHVLEGIRLILEAIRMPLEESGCRIGPLLVRAAPGNGLFVGYRVPAGVPSDVVQGNLVMCLILCLQFSHVATGFLGVCAYSDCFSAGIIIASATACSSSVAAL